MYSYNNMLSEKFGFLLQRMVIRLVESNIRSSGWNVIVRLANGSKTVAHPRVLVEDLKRHFQNPACS